MNRRDLMLGIFAFSCISSSAIAKTPVFSTDELPKMWKLLRDGNEISAFNKFGNLPWRFMGEFESIPLTVQVHDIVIASPEFLYVDVEILQPNDVDYGRGNYIRRPNHFGKG